jgi:uncharacterized protein HemX
MGGQVSAPKNDTPTQVPTAMEATRKWSTSAIIAVVLLLIAVGVLIGVIRYQECNKKLPMYITNYRNGLKADRTLPNWEARDAAERVFNSILASKEQEISQLAAQLSRQASSFAAELAAQLSRQASSFAFHRRENGATAELGWSPCSFHRGLNI